VEVVVVVVVWVGECTTGDLNASDGLGPWGDFAALI
jgi:hypothetical protein